MIICSNNSFFKKGGKVTTLYFVFQPLPIWASQPNQAVWDPSYLQKMDPRYSGAGGSSVASGTNAGGGGGVMSTSYYAKSSTSSNNRRNKVNTEGRKKNARGVSALVS